MPVIKRSHNNNMDKIPHSLGGSLEANLNTASIELLLCIPLGGVANQDDRRDRLLGSSLPPQPYPAESWTLAPWRGGRSVVPHCGLVLLGGPLGWSLQGAAERYAGDGGRDYGHWDDTCGLSLH
ncbi:hypothetical protein NDU88_004566 [Pleurodeles waltl]|uniref:Uncharacterized protein n=1 Tax=Pleurodeles waltl TaxID=8319 RepID=A0AAV7T8A2_PLEWA|nr:hypothetical protein NDU88_004565 [Pleurodeles waltl]KAJ1172722.1 hypothetical protein NDU88_004566 [Pleurodeles waltl]